MDFSLLPAQKKKQNSIISLLKYNLNTISKQTNLTFLFKTFSLTMFKWTSFQITSKFFYYFKKTLKIKIKCLL